ncbi:CHASE domain-containing protein [Candidatus Saccharibacteria bacterium]|nr:CHASE domain-containing protein [Candidatus Saccharibacteria bacterium]
MNHKIHKALFMRPWPATRILMLVSIAAVVIAIVLAAQLYFVLLAQSRDRFGMSADTLTTSVVAQMDHYQDILYQASSFYQKNPTMSQTEWRGFFESQQTLERYEGVSSVNFVEAFDANGKAAFEQKLRAEPYFGGASFKLTPTDQTTNDYAVLALSYSDNDISGVYGFNVLSTEDRRHIYELAYSRRIPTTSGPTLLKSGHKGYYSLLAVPTATGGTAGYALVSYRIADSIPVLFRQSPMSGYKVTDATDASNPYIIYESDDWSATDVLRRIDIVSVGGRSWSIQYSANLNFGGVSEAHLYPLIIIASGFGMAGTLLGVRRSLQRKNRSLL